MNIKVFILTLITLSIQSTFIYGQTSDQAQMQKQIDEMMKRRDEMLRSLLNDDSFQEMEKRMQNMMKEFSENGAGFDNDFFGSSVVGEYDWKETDKYKILSLKIKQIKDKPLDIKIEKGQIRLKGDVEEVSEEKSSKSKRISKVHF